MDIEQEKQKIEEIVGEAHLQTNGILRCAVTIGDAANRAHLFVFQVFSGDRLYMVMKFQEGLQNHLNMQLSGKAPKNKVNFDEMLT